MKFSTLTQRPVMSTVFVSKKGWFKPLTPLYNFTSLATLFKCSPMRKGWTFEIKLKWPYLCISCNFPWYTYFNFFINCAENYGISQSWRDIWRKLLCLGNPFEVIWNLKSSFETWKFNLDLKTFYSVWKFIWNMDPAECAMCVY